MVRCLWAAHEMQVRLPDPSLVHEVSIIFGAWLYGEDAGKPHAIEVQAVSLERR